MHKLMSTDAQPLINSVLIITPIKLGRDTVISLPYTKPIGAQSSGLSATAHMQSLTVNPISKLAQSAATSAPRVFEQMPGVRLAHR